MLLFLLSTFLPSFRSNIFVSLAADLNVNEIAFNKFIVTKKSELLKKYLKKANFIFFI